MALFGRTSHRDYTFPCSVLQLSAPHHDLIRATLSYPEVERFKKMAVVIKRVTFQAPNTLKSQDRAVEVMRELCFGESLHPNVVELVDCFEVDDKDLGKQTWIVMEDAGSSTLSQHLSRSKDGALREDEVRCLFHQVLSALLFIQSKGFAFMDLNSDNVIMNERRAVKLCDFASCTPLAETMSPKLRRGKLVSMAPEVFAGQQFNPALADVWSLGVLLFRLLFGAQLYRIPAPSDPGFTAAVSSQLHRFIQKRKFTQKVSTSALDLLQWMLQREGQRPSLQQVLDHEWLHPSDA